MNSSIQPLHGLVLAGGRSARMGTDKAALIHPDGRALARRTCDLLIEAGCDQVFLSLRHDQELPPGFGDLTGIEIVRDPENASDGPMTGMIRAMDRAPDARWLIVACDLPRLDVETLRHLVESMDSEETFLSYRSEFDGLPEPLCAVYSPGSLEILRAAAAEGLHCPRKILIRHSCRLIEPFVERALENANTPAEWQAARTP